ncbi:TRAP transporter small permease [Sediminibacillus massiliensis]|uniref:TRAP transporter small permease n=1 Tax=Sediminibacillus massiliensis TaxID=1926277 RepID=UPI000BADE2CF|nr:TRAP transporter small permease [Sediminibacillus massiliensis]
MKFFRAIDKFILKLEEIILSYAVLLIAVMVVGNVLSRAITGSSWSFSNEISKFAIVLATFMGISYAARKGRHISMSAFYDLAPFKVRKALAIFIPAVTAIILFVLTYYSSLHVISIYESGRVTTALQLPSYYISIFIPIGLFMGGIQYLRNVWINIREKEVYLGTDLKDYNDDSSVTDQTHV